MSTTIPVDSDFQRLVVEQALAREMESTAAAAPQGKGLHQCEGLLLTRGREFLLRTLQAMAQHTADEVVKKIVCSQLRLRPPPAAQRVGLPLGHDGPGVDHREAGLFHLLCL